MEPQTQNSNAPATALVTPEASVDELQLKKVDHEIKQSPTSPLLEEELVIEEVSIDGMCGVY